MGALSGFFQELLILYSMIGIGYLAKATNILKEHADEVLAQLILSITLPALIVYSMNIPFSATYFKDFIILLSLSIYTLSTACLIGFWMKKVSTLPQLQKGVYEALIIFGNQGFIGYAVCFLLLGQKGIVYAAIFNIPYLILIWTYGMYIVGKTQAAIRFRQIVFNPGIIATFIGMILLVLPVQLPYHAESFLKQIGTMTLPLSMFLIGSLLATLKLREMVKLCFHRSLSLAALLKLLIIPLLLFPFILLSLPFSLLLTAALISGTPSAPTTALYAAKYRADASFASAGVLVSTLLSLFSIPLLYGLVQLIY